jgi:3-deoxy-D-manno-octulosonic-acid transferase
MLKDYLYNLATDKNKGPVHVIPKLFLFLLSLFYWMLVKALIFFNTLAPQRASCKVISVGNITLGGTGKTPLVEFIAGYLKSRGKKVALLIRGYKRKSQIPNSKSQTSDTMGDEAYMLAQKLEGIPVIVDTDRRRALASAIKNYAVDTVILDDGFQQWRLKKDLEIVTIGASNPFGNRHLMPRGILREPLSSLKRADILLLTKTNLAGSLQETKERLRKINPGAMIMESSHSPLGFFSLNRPGQLMGVDKFIGRRVALFCGIGDPESFRSLITALQIKAELFFRFPDHHCYGSQDLRKISDACREHNIETAITTEKDAVRLEESGILPSQPQLWCLKIAIKLNDEDGFRDRLFKLYSL